MLHGHPPCPPCRPIPMKRNYTKVKTLDTPYSGISVSDYHQEKRRLQLELLKIQQRCVAQGLRVAVTFDGRDAAGKGSTIRRITQNMMPKHYRIVELGIPSRSEARYWFRRYERLLPQPGEMVFFDRSWYNRGLIEPTMGYCTKAQYTYFMNKVLKWEHALIRDGMILIKFYLSVDSDTQMYRFRERLSDPLKFWKFTPNDYAAREKWEIYTQYKEQMFARTSSKKSPWIEVSSNTKMECFLTCMLHIIRVMGQSDFESLTGEDVNRHYSIEIDGVQFTGLNSKQYAVLMNKSQSDSEAS